MTGKEDTIVNNFRQFIGIGIILSLSILLFIAIYSHTVPNRDSQLAKQGVLDLRGWDFHKQGLVALDGEWEFYEGKLLEPADFSEAVRSDATYLFVPGTWEGKKKDGGMSRKGFGTYRLKVLVDNNDDIYGLKVRSVRMSHSLYIDGKLEGGSGSPAIVKEANISGNTPYSTFFHAQGKEIEIIIQVANYEFTNGGIINSIQFGWHGDITKLNSLLIGSDLAYALIFVMFGAYHLSLYVLRNREKTYLYSGMYLFSLALIQLLFGEKLLQRLMPEIPFYVVYKSLDLSEFLSSVLSILFFSSMDGRLISHRMKIALISPNVVYIAAILVLPYSLYNEVRGIFFLYMALVPLYLLGRMIYLFGTSPKGTSERKELLLFIGVIISLLIFLVDGTLYAENMISTDLRGKAAVIGFISLMNLLLAARLTTAYTKTETLTHQLTISNQLKDEFLMHTSHEVKTPLHGIMNITSYLLDDDERNLSAKQKQNLWLIKDTSVKLSMLMRDLIDVTRLKQGELRMHMTVVDMRSVTQIVFDVLHFELAGKEVMLENQVPPNVWVHADESRLRQLLYNLIHNAIKHTEKGTITVTSVVVGDMIRISVTDTGIGIVEERRSNIFEYFEQLDQVLPDDGYTGMGVGLYISRKLIERMEGQIWVDWSEVNVGTRMVFTLKHMANYTAADEAAAMNETTVPRMSESKSSLDLLEQHAHTILIVDDEASNIHTLLNILKRHRYNVITAFSAKEALVKIKAYAQIDLVILDVMMPDISGIELCRMLRFHYSILDLPILFATVKDTSQDIAIGFRAGANDYLTKPFEAEPLIARIQTLIAMKTSIQEAIRNELAFHQAQIKPHFLYNALSSVISFCYTDGEKAAYLLSQLSQYLRYILDMDRNDLFVSVSRELELIEAYVEIEKARFGDRFDFICYIDESLKHMPIPSLSIQPFVENSIRHGLFEKEGFGTVTLTIQEGDRHLQIIVQDDGVGMDDDLLYGLVSGKQGVGGIGISNIRRRLDSIPGATWNVDSELGRGTKVTIYLPLAGSSDEA
ncbi:ATP-binding protein [Paenibacillus alginolyticus]|uniref:histidine kinase n=1 Tax=Paenibacillus alginolyticus TaxID=59839 RepID=A0ABT4GI18_9BACL|nr:ATP-binding protein [Paenibacillus alginolyticus]MEC0142232.1 ATP-binding protein [Paenibacillus alginolyticus]